jgi:alpha-1,2-mannosyltransferase
VNLTFLQHGAWRKVGWVLELAPFVAAVIVLPYVIPGGRPWPWSPNTMDLRVYLEAGHALTQGGDIINLRFTQFNLAFIYPMFAALIAVPLSYVPYKLMQLLWTFASVLLIRTLLRRFGVPAGVLVGIVGVVIVLLCQPIRATLGYGQVNVMVMSLVLLDLLPGRRIGPRGAMTGVAAGIKLTPGLFILYLAALRRWRDAAWALGVFLATSLIGLIILPGETVAFWQTLLRGDTRTGAAYYLGNQSVLGGMVRLFGDGGTVHAVATVVGGLTGLAAVWAAARWSRRGEELFALGLVGLGTVMASPLSWTHHFVWVVPLGFALFRYALPRSIKVVGGLFSVWVFSGLVLQWLPYDQGRELLYGFGQNLVSAITPILGVALVIIALVTSRGGNVVEPTVEHTADAAPAPEFVDTAGRSRPLPQPIY